MSDEKADTNRPSFSAPLYAALRQGSKEFGQALVALPDSNIRPVEEPGTLGNPTQAMVTEEIGTVSGYRAMLADYASRGGEREADDRGMDR